MDLALKLRLFHSCIGSSRLAASFLVPIRELHLSIRSRGRYTITDITQAGNTALQFGGLFERASSRVRSSIFGYSGVARDYGVRGLGLIG